MTKTKGKKMKKELYRARTARGVFREKSTDKWLAYVQSPADQQRRILGSFSTRAEAAQRVNRAVANLEPNK
jgi:hypothetical protein